jgi:antitoxin FitA
MVYFHYETILEPSMATLTIKNIPDELYQHLKEQALRNHRSLNSEVIVSLEQAVQYNKPLPGVILKEARRLREKTVKYRLTNKKLKAAKEEGRS